MRIGRPPAAAGGTHLDARRQHARALPREPAQRRRAAKAAVKAEEGRIAATREGLGDAERRLAVLDARAQKRRTQLDETQDKLVAARVRLTRLEKKQVEAEKTLAENLRHNYMDGEPSFATVVLNADGFTDLVERFEFLRRIARRNASVLGDTRDARIKVKGMTSDLTDLRTTYSKLSREADEDRNRADAIRTALLNREQQQLSKRNGTAAKLASVRGKIAAIERRQAAAARRAMMAASATSAAPGVSGNTGAGGGGGGDVVGRVVAAANQIATTPYVWGGGSGGASGGYDCSGSISYALAAGGLLHGCLVSTGSTSWGDAGRRAHHGLRDAGHAFMVVDGRRYDTSACPAAARAGRARCGDRRSSSAILLASSSCGWPKRPSASTASVTPTGSESAAPIDRGDGRPADDQGSRKEEERETEWPGGSARVGPAGAEGRPSAAASWRGRGTQQHADIRQILLDTGDTHLIEHTANDAYWAYNGDGKLPENMVLEIILMEVRDELRPWTNRETWRDVGPGCRGHPGRPRAGRPAPRRHARGPGEPPDSLYGAVAAEVAQLLHRRRGRGDPVDRPRPGSDRRGAPHGRRPPPAVTPSSTRPRQQRDRSRPDHAAARPLRPRARRQRRAGGAQQGRAARVDRRADPAPRRGLGRPRGVGGRGGGAAARL